MEKEKQMEVCTEYVWGTCYIVSAFPDPICSRLHHWQKTEKTKRTLGSKTSKYLPVLCLLVITPIYNRIHPFTTYKLVTTKA